MHCSRRPIGLTSFDRLGGAQTRTFLIGSYLPSFQISAASFQSLPIFSHTTRYLPVTSCGVGPLVLRLKVPISRAAEGLEWLDVEGCELRIADLLRHPCPLT